MKGKITVVSLVVLLLAAVAWVMTIGGVTARSDSTGAFAVGLAAHTDQITRIELDRESKKIVLVRAADGLWRVETSGGYLASTAQVAGLVNGIASLEKDGKMTSKVEKYEELALDWPPAQGSRAALVRVFETVDASGTGAPFAEYVIGHERASPRTQYVRKLEDVQCWRCRGSVSVEMEPQRWMDVTLLSLPDGEIDSASIDGLSLTRSARSKEFTTVITPESAALWTPERVTEATRTLPLWLSRLEFDDVRPASSSPMTGEPRTFTFDSLRARIVVQCSTESDGVWARFEVTPHEGAPHPNEGLNGDVNAKHKYAGDPQVPDWTAWSAAHMGWEFKLPAWKIQELKFEPSVREEPPPPR